MEDEYFLVLCCGCLVIFCKENKEKRQRVQDRKKKNVQKYSVFNHNKINISNVYIFQVQPIAIFENRIFINVMIYFRSNLITSNIISYITILVIYAPIAVPNSTEFGPLLVNPTFTQPNNF